MSAYKIGGLAYPIIIAQFGVDRFSVQYGMQITSNLNYADAGRELGLCIMHALACEGIIDNKERTR